jgi:cyanuric acid amidohydrolase
MTATVPQQCHVYRVPMAYPGDVSEIDRLINQGHLDPASIIAILGKTEGNGCVNDFTRGYAVSAVATLLAERLRCTTEEVSSRVALIMSGGTEGGLSPHFLVFAVVGATAVASDESPSLAVGTAFTGPIAPEDIGGLGQIHATAEAVLAAMVRARINEPADVHFVQIKCPLLTKARMHEVLARGRSVRTADTYASMGLSRGASALGVALALGEIEAGDLPEENPVVADLGLWSSRASASAGIELMRSEILLMGNSRSWVGPLLIAHGVMQDAIDLGAIRRTLDSLGLFAEGQLSVRQSERILAVLVKAEASRCGTIRGRRHIMSDDSDINSTRHARALVGGVVAAALGRTDLFVSGGAEHQGPDGGGPIAIIAQKG